MLSKNQELFTMAMREVRAELGRIPSQSVRDSVSIYLRKLQDRLAELYEESDKRFKRSEFETACALSDRGADDTKSRAA